MLVKRHSAWSSLAGTVFVPHSDEEYRRLVMLLDNLIDEVGEDEAHPLASLMEIVGVLIQNYEDQNVPELTTNQPSTEPFPLGSAVRPFLMPVGTAFHNRTFPTLREPELSRVVWLLRGQLLRTSSRTRVQRYS